MRVLTAIAQGASVSRFSGLVSPFVLINCLYGHIVDSLLYTNQLSHVFPGVLVNQWYFIY